jgi:hypothetical protein
VQTVGFAKGSERTLLYYPMSHLGSAKKKKNPKKPSYETHEILLRGKPVWVSHL